MTTCGRRRFYFQAVSLGCIEAPLKKDLYLCAFANRLETRVLCAERAGNTMADLSGRLRDARLTASDCRIGNEELIWLWRCGAAAVEVQVSGGPPA